MVRPKKYLLLGVGLTIGLVCLLKIGLDSYLENRRLAQCRENLMRIELGLQLYCSNWRNGEVPDLELPRLFDTPVDGGLYLIGGRNPYTGERVKYIPFGDPPSPGDVTGYIGEVACITWRMGGWEEWNVQRDYERCYYLYMYGPEGEPGMDINWDGVPDGVMESRRSGFPCPAGRMFLPEPLDVIMDRHGIAHGPAPESFAQCIWGKPCKSSGRQFMGLDCENAGACVFCGENDAE